ncbi:hypothetical protein PS1_022861 [Malus domestica]
MRYRDHRGRFAKRSETIIETLFGDLFESDSEFVNMADHAVIEGEGNPPPRTLKDYLHPTCVASPSCIVFPANMSNYEFKYGMVHLFPIFHGLENEDPYVHVREYEDDVSTFYNIAHDQLDGVRLNFFSILFKRQSKKLVVCIKG